MNELRGITRYFYIANLCLEKAIEQDFVKHCYLEAQYIRNMQIPVSVFKPFRIGMKISIDPRRARRYLRKKNKGARIISMNDSPKTIDVTFKGTINSKEEWFDSLLGLHSSEDKG